MKNPAVSVVLPVYNCPQYVDEAINSIFAQTFDDFELIVIDDGSTDETPLVLRKYLDRRMTLIRQENQGLAATLNRGIELSKGRYVARQDQDDASFPQRFAKQVAFLDQHPECGIVGTWAEIWRERAMTKRRTPSSSTSTSSGWLPRPASWPRASSLSTCAMASSMWSRWMTAIYATP